MQGQVRKQPNVHMTDGSVMPAWEFDWEGETFYIQETGGPLHILRQVGDGWAYPGDKDSQAVMLEAFNEVQKLGNPDWIPL
jgi:hypothetical protein